ncbi:hypothetical protein [Pusillimonas minor]|uniref:Uncharacterized protein n=1 Tax=Pusillimonas minor TaxID=2697024 RepID=A0A842HTH5_9BURK|nr:hypothetical protein [Pusillimonas minor]MBC2771064.1 hypothetical protein [Pusillimonas minor]
MKEIRPVENILSSCLVCGSMPTIKSHLIPRAMAREVQVGKAHAVAFKPGKFSYTQSGLYEQNILCAACDNKLGLAEKLAIQTFRRIRKEAKALPVGEYLLSGIAGDSILRFICGVLWKYSVASKENGRIALGRYQDILQKTAFTSIDVPSGVDAILCRLKRHKDDDEVFAYRAPSPDRKEGVNGYRLLVGGIFIFLKLDRQIPARGALARASIRNRPDLPYVVLHAEDFEEYKLPSKLINNDGRLSSFLDKQEKQ